MINYLQNLFLDCVQTNDHTTWPFYGNSMKKYFLFLNFLIMSNETSILRYSFQIIASILLKRNYEMLDLYQPNISFLYSLNASKHQRYSDIFRGYRDENLAKMG